MSGSRKKRGKYTDPRRRREARFRLVARDGRHCHWCGDRLAWKAMTLDHVIDLADGGTNADSNLVLACKACNNERGRENDRLRTLIDALCKPGNVSRKCFT